MFNTMMFYWKIFCLLVQAYLRTFGTTYMFSCIDRVHDYASLRNEGELHVVPTLLTLVF